MQRKILSMIFALCSLALTAGAAGRQFVLVIDAGHGGKDSGALGAYSKEKNINLNVALAFGRYVENNCPDVKVVYTRKTDVFVTLEGRAAIANRNKADLFVSIHTNALENRHISRGMETYTLGMHRASDNLDVAMRENSVILIEKDYKERYQGFDPKSSESYIIFELMQDQNMAQSVEMAKLVQQKACATAGRQNKGVKQAGFLVLRETSMPSCLIELGFITTPDEESYLNSAAGIDALGRGIYQAFAEYKKKRNPQAKVPYKGEDEAKPVVVPNIVPPAPKPAEADTAMQNDTPVADQREVAGKDEKTNQNDTGTSATQDEPVFKVQIMASSTKLKTSSPQFKGITGISSYQEGGMTKYTVGESTDYQEISRLRRTLSEKFPQAFIVAFRGTERISIDAARQEYNRKKGRK